MPGRELDLHLHLLDRQVVDRDGRLLCKVDDVELQPDADGGLVVTAILIGPRALGPRLGGRLGHWMSSIAARLAHNPMPRIEFSRVTDIGSAITVTGGADQLHLAPLEDWVDEHIISRIPGSRHAQQ